jgi:transcriptional regulator NrdR family protein
MKCPECGEAMRTKDTREWRDEDREFNWIERKRACSSCDYRVMTIEMAKEIWNKYSEGRSK